MIKSHLKSCPKGFQPITPQMAEAAPEVLTAYDHVVQAYRSVIAAATDQEASDIMIDAVWLDHPEGMDALMDADPEIALLQARAWSRVNWL